MTAMRSRRPLWLSVALSAWGVFVAGALLLTTQQNVLGWLLCATATAAGIGWAIHARLAPVRALAQDASHLAATSDHGHLPATGPQELAQLSEAINQLASRLADANAEVRAHQHEQDAILQSMQGGVLTLDREQRILGINLGAAELLGLTGKSLRGVLIHEVARFPALLQFISTAMEKPESRAEVELRDDERRAVRITSAALRDSESNITGIILLMTDITKMKRLEAVRTDFAANVSHELRTPITNIKGYAETLLEVGQSDPELATKFLKIIATNADRLGALVDDILALASLERAESKESLPTAPTPLRQVLESARSQVEPEAASKQISIHIQAGDDLHAMANARLMEQAVVNLVSNAVKYSPARSRVWVESTRRLVGTEPWIEVVVRDEGPGIASEHLPRIFERFYRVDKARSREQGGTGLGLAIVKHIALAHGGKVSVESSIGKGSTFRLWLPAA